MEADHPAEPLEKAIIEAFSAVLPLLGMRAFGPLAQSTPRIRQQLEAQRNKYELVRERLGEQDSDEDAIGLLQRYLSTKPAPLLVARFRQAHTEWVDEAERQNDAGTDLVVLEQNTELVAALLDPAQLDLDAAAQLAVIAARLAPLMARNTFSQFLAEAAWQNPEEPEAQTTAERTHAILAARCVLRKIGSPLDLVTADDVPDSADAQLHELPGLVDASWALWDALD